jgi:type IV fimbrial biogenesis protein FimT
MDSGNKQNGFTLIEMLVTIAIVSIIITLSTPLSNVYKRNRVSSQVQEFVSALNVARSEAVTLGSTVSMCISDGATPANCAATALNPKVWDGGWLVFIDTNANCFVNAGETIINQRNAMSTGFSLRVPARECIQYTAAGIAPAANGTWTLCDPSATAILSRGINISVSGRALIMNNAQAVAAGFPLAACP